MQYWDAYEGNFGYMYGSESKSGKMAKGLSPNLHVKTA